ncbi:uncharacterized protein [Watersipora subatra]|uniref:uncharacterized protein n=1 Tax=Watersipora subatra TaxID=2589382 RepID=UPI00355C4DBC
MLEETQYGYQFKSGTKINHLFYMDDIKLYANKEKDIDSLIHLSQVHSKNIGMTFSIEKCARLILKKDHSMLTDGLRMPNGTIKYIEEGYKNLGILHSNINHEVEVRHKAITEYKSRLGQVLQSQLNAKNQVMAINTYALPVIRYSAGIIKWTEEAINETNIATRKLLTMHGALHPKSDTTRLYFDRKDGGRGLKSLQQRVKEEEQGIKAHAASMATSGKCLGEFQSAALTMDLRHDDEKNDWRTKPVHGAYRRQISKVGDLHQTYMWLKNGNLTTNTDSLIIAAQEQVLPTRQLQTKVYHTRDDPRFRLCRDAPQTIQHIISGCKQLAGNDYPEWHNHVARVLYRSLCNEYGLNKPQHSFEGPVEVNENDLAKILWDFYSRIHKHVLANQPDIVVVDKENKRPILIDIEVPNDYNIASKKRQVRERSPSLRRDLKMLGCKNNCSHSRHWGTERNNTGA